MAFPWGLLNFTPKAVESKRPRALLQPCGPRVKIPEALLSELSVAVFDSTSFLVQAFRMNG